VASAPVPWLPLAARVPLHAPEPLQEVEFAEVQVNAAESPASMFNGDALIDAVGKGAGGLEPPPHAGSQSDDSRIIRQQTARYPNTCFVKLYRRSPLELRPLLYFGVVAQKQKHWLASANFGLAILAFINLFSYLDRYVVSGVLESLKHSDLGLTDTNLGSLMSGFLVVYTLLAPVFGALGDRRSRPRLIALGVACWSFATALSGFAVNYLTLFAARAAVGVGEAAYVTIAPSLLSDYFPVRQRGRIMAIFFCAIPVGSALGYVVGGLVDKHYGWRAAFFVAGVPGLLLAALCLLLRDPPRGIQDGADSAAKA
jgi:hypothetical protein